MESTPALGLKGMSVAFAEADIDNASIPVAPSHK
jgi:hypothetical protein